MDQATVKKICTFSAIAKEVWDQFLQNHSRPDLFRKYFHLRPTSQGITIVSTLPEAPMRGISTKNAEDLKNKLTLIDAALSKLVSDDPSLRKEILTSLGFKTRATQSRREEDAQAAFIRGMLSNDPMYEGIQFVASELCLEKSNRFDVVGLKDDTLFIFELKRNRTTLIADQSMRYYDHINQYRQEFDAFLSVYPTLPNISFNHVKEITVMRHAENSPRSKWEDYSKTSTIDVWLFEESLTFDKINYL